MRAAPQPRADAVRAEAARLYAAHRRWVYALCRGRLGTREDAEDAVQLTFLYALRSLQRDVSPEREFAWLRTIADNVCRTRRRDASNRSHVEAVSDVHAVEHLLPARERADTDLDALRAALETLPDAQRRAVLLREWQGLSYKEIATALGLSEPAVETLLFRARRRLARSLAEVRRALDVAAAVRVVRRLRAGGAAKGAAAVASVGVVAAAAGPPLARHIEHLLHGASPHVQAVTPTRARPAPGRESPLAARVPRRTERRHGNRGARSSQTGAPVTGPATAATQAPATVHVQPARATPSSAAAPDRPAASTTTVASSASSQPAAGTPAVTAPPPAPSDPVASTVDSAGSTASSAVSAVTTAAGQATDTATSTAGQAVSTVTSAVDTVTSAVDTVTSTVPTVSVPTTPPPPKLP